MANNKDPAVLFYTSDFLSGCALMDMRERGQYITLLCLQRERGHMTMQEIIRAVKKPSDEVKVTDLFFVAAHELGMLKSPAKAKELLDKMEQLDAEYGVAWLGKKESDDAIHRLDSSLKNLCGPFFQPFFERNDTIKDWWEK